MLRNARCAKPQSCQLAWGMKLPSRGPAADTCFTSGAWLTWP